MTNPDWPHAAIRYAEAHRIIDANGNRVDPPTDETWEAQAEPVHVTATRLIETHFGGDSTKHRMQRLVREWLLKQLLKNPYEDKP